MSGAQDDPDLLAAEYALGTLDGEERITARARIEADAEFGSAVAAWERRLAPLSRLVQDVSPPPDLWARVAASSTTATVVVLPPKRLRLWQATAAAALAIAAGLAAFIVVRSPPQPVVAVLAPTNGASVLLAFAGPNGGFTVQPAGPLAQVPPGRDLELWELPSGALHPRSLGVLPASGRHLETAPAPGTRILVSLEPRGGSPSGQPTGPVLYSGQLQRL